jgi:glutaredoxin
MKIVLKLLVIIITLLLLISSGYIVFYKESDGTKSNDQKDNTDNETKDDNNDDNENNNGNENDFVSEHIVFIEEGTATTCKPCTEVAKILKELYETENYQFYYVSIVSDVNTKAEERLYNDYNVMGVPTVFFDSGYNVIMGARTKSDFENLISDTASRKVQNLDINVSSKWNEINTDLNTTVTVENKGSVKYTGCLKVYITEIKSRWNDYNGEPYHFAFLDYAINETIEIKGKNKITVTKTWDANYPDVYPENLWVIAVVFNSESNQKFSVPDDNKYPFDAYYADGANATRVAEGVLPPTVGISSIKEGMRYINGKEKGKATLLKKTVLIGKTTIKVNADAEAGVEKVEFIIKGKFKQTIQTDTEEPYEFTWDKFAFGKYTIIAKLYDKDGKIATDSIDVLALILNLNFLKT